MTTSEAAAGAGAGAGAGADGAKKTRTGYVWNERYMWHHAGKYTWK